MSRLALGWLVLSVIWGTTWLAVRIGLNDLPPMTFAGMRFLTAALLLFAVIRMKRLRLPRASADWALVAQVGLLGIGVTYAAQFWGQQYVPQIVMQTMVTLDLLKNKYIVLVMNTMTYQATYSLDIVCVQ